LTDYAFTAQCVDKYTDLQYHRARWLDTGLGRWMSEDPVFDFPNNYGGVYLYAGNNTVNGTDKSGMFNLLDVLISAVIVGIIVGIASATYHYVQTGGEDPWGSLQAGVLGFVFGFSIVFAIGVMILYPPSIASISAFFKSLGQFSAQYGGIMKARAIFYVAAAWLGDKLAFNSQETYGTFTTDILPPQKRAKLQRTIDFIKSNVDPERGNKLQSMLDRNQIRYEPTISDDDGPVQAAKAVLGQNLIILYPEYFEIEPEKYQGIVLYHELIHTEQTSAVYDTYYGVLGQGIFSSYDDRILEKEAFWYELEVLHKFGFSCDFLDEPDWIKTPEADIVLDILYYNGYKNIECYCDGKIGDECY